MNSFATGRSAFGGTRGAARSGRRMLAIAADRLRPGERPTWRAASTGVALGVALALTATTGLSGAWKITMIAALIVLAALAAAWPSTILTGAVTVVVVVTTAADPQLDLAPVRVAVVAALLTAFVAATHWPGSAALDGWSLSAAVIGVPAAAVVAAAAELHAAGTVWFLVGLVATAAAALVALAPALRWSTD